VIWKPQELRGHDPRWVAAPQQEEKKTHTASRRSYITGRKNNKITSRFTFNAFPTTESGRGKKVYQHPKKN
jgi:hypothetical protein